MTTLSKHEKYLQKVRIRHGDRYDLSKLIYIDSTTPIIVICKIHGEFTKNPSEFLRDGGCRACGNVNKTMSWSDVQEEFEMIHGKKFDYSLSNYKNNKTKIEIICREHNTSFMMTPQNHKMFGGCPTCRSKSYGQHLKLDFDEFLDKVKAIHGDRYDLSESEYKGYDYPISVRCYNHGVFTLKTKNLLRGMGCPSCKD
jgi:Zn finger protein HypA/HybF involved in hydrogenase expression